MVPQYHHEGWRLGERGDGACEGGQHHKGKETMGTIAATVTGRSRTWSVLHPNASTVRVVLWSSK